MIQHKDIPDDQRHPPKGFEGAPVESALVKGTNGQLEYRPLSELGETGPPGPPGPDGNAIAKVVIVQKNPGISQFSDPIAAMASILDASASNPYVLKVGPGIYSLSAPLLIKEFVTLKVDGHGATILEPANPNNDIIQIQTSNCRVQGFLLRNATGPSAAAIRITSAPTPAVVDFVTIQNCTEEIVLESSTAIVQAVLRNIRLIAGATTKKLLRVTATGGFAAIARIYSAILTDDLGTVFEDAILIDGAGARLDGNTLLARSTVGIGNGIRVSDGGELVSQAGAEIEGFNKNILIENVGAAPIFRSTTIMARSAVDKDLEIAHPGTTGSALVKATLTKVLIHDDAPVKLVLTCANPAEDVGIFVRGDILQADKFSRKINLSKLGRAAATMGRQTGGALTVGAGLNVEVAAGNGFLIDTAGQFVKEVPWAAATLPIPANSSLYIYVNTSGVVSTSGSLPDIIENIILGRVATLDTTIHFIQDTPVDLNQIGNYLELFHRGAIGPIYASGSMVSENVGTARALDITAGKYWFGTNPFSPSGGVALAFSSFYRKLVSGFNVITGVTQVDNANYDDGSGAVVALAAGKFAKHSLYVVGEGASEKYFMVYGQAQLNSLVEAEAADIPLPPTSFDDAVTLIATIIVEQGNATLRIYDARPIIGFKAPGISASSTHGNLLGLNQDDHPQYLLVNGSRAMAADLNMGGNNITNVGLVKGVDVSAHGSRHNPGGADPIATAAAIELTDSTNAEGNAGSVARSNHTHAHGNRGGGALHAIATTIANGFMSAADKVRVDAIETLADGQIALQKGAANGLTPLGADSKVPAIYLPSFVDDALEFANLAAFPVTGETGKIYVALDSNKTYRWSGSSYIEISPSPGTTDALAEGIVNLYFTAARVLATVLTGLSTASSAVIDATDTVLSALGKLQAQVTLRALAARLINAGYGLTGGGNLTADRTLAVSLTQSQVQVTGDLAVNNAADTLITGMSITPGAGTYLAIFSTSCTMGSGASSGVIVSLYANGVQVTGTERQTQGGSVTQSLSTQSTITVADGQAIDARFRTTNGAQTMKQRVLTLVRIA